MTRDDDRRERWVPRAVAALIALVVLAPLVRPGYVLAYDMMFVPRQPLRWDLIAPAAGLPRAVPQDAVVSLLSQVGPGWLWQRVALVAAVYGAALGAARLVPAERLLTRVVAAVAYAWTPFLAERLLLGQWGLLLGYAALPWLVAAAIGVRQGVPRSWARLVLAAAPAAITPTGGLIALAATAVLTAGRTGRQARTCALAVGAVLVLNGPWLVASVLTAAGGRSDPTGVAAFAARAENWSGAVGALAGTGGIWNSLTTPPSRAALAVPLVTVVSLIVAGYGFGRLRARWPAGAAARLGWLAAAGFGVALLGTVAPTARILAWAVGAVPGAGLLRDGQKFVLPYALMLALCVALGVQRLAGRLAEPRARLVFAAMIALPVAVLPDLAFGAGGALRAVAYPPDWDQVAARIAASPGDVVSLPLSEYRAYAWNDWRTVIDPAPRYLPADVLVDDTLRVGELTVEGEDPRVARVRELLADGRPVAAAGTAWVLVQRDSGPPPTAASLAGLDLVYSGQFLRLYANPHPAAPAPPAPARRWLLAGVDLLALGVVLAAFWHLRPRATAW